MKEPPDSAHDARVSAASHADPAMDHLAQQRLGSTLNGKWQLDAILGVGGMATVYAATHRNGHRVAVKMLHPLLSAQDAPRERFLREGYISNKVDHPDAVCVLDEDVDEDGNVFLVMELLEGEPVSARWHAAGRRLPAAEALWIANRLLLVLEAAHAKGVVHRDLKPENLFLTLDGRLKVLDFGIARFGVTGTGNTLQGVVMGTPGFVAPEQVRGEWDRVDARTDLFAVGATIFTLVVGKLIHEGSTSQAHWTRIAREPPRPVREIDATVPPSLAQLIDRALSFRPQDRYQSAAEMRQAVVAAFFIITGQPLSERAPATPLASTHSARLDGAATPRHPPSQAAPTVASPGLTRPPRARSSLSRNVRALASACLGTGVLALGYWGSSIRPRPARHADPVSIQAALPEPEVTTASEPATRAPSVVSSLPIEPMEPSTEQPDAPDGSGPPLAPASARPLSPVPPRTAADRKAPSGNAASQSVVIEVAKPVLSAPERAQVPEIGRPLRTRPSPAPADQLDFVEGRH